MSITTHPLTPERWEDFEDLFETAGVTRGCWCMWWRLRAKDFNATGRGDLRAAFRARVEAGPPPGILAYDGEQAVGWVQVTPRRAIPRFNTGRTSKPLDPDDLDGVWALSCFFIRKSQRRQGLMTLLAKAAVEMAGRAGARVVEAVPIRPRDELQWSDGFVGIVPALERAGFTEIGARGVRRVYMQCTPGASPTRPISGSAGSAPRPQG